MKFSSLVLSSLLWGSALLSSNDSENHYFVEIKAANSAERTNVANLVHIDFVVENYVYSVVTAHDLEKLNQVKADIVSVEPIEIKSYDPGEFYMEKAYGALDFPREDALFHNYDEMLKEFQDIVKQYPDLTSLFSIGKSFEGREIWGLKIAQPEVSAAKGPKPAILYMATHHAREHVSTEMPILFAKKFLKNLVNDDRLKDIIGKLDIYLIPMVNPDGAQYDISTGSYKWWRKNRRSNRGGSYGVDLNRNYGFGWGTGGSSTDPSSDVYMGSKAFSEPETVAIRDFFTANPNIQIALSFHTFSELILYPWGHKKEGVSGPDGEAMRKMAVDMSQWNHYKPMQSSGLYIASGDTCDWVYGELKKFCFTFELSPSSMWEGGFYPGADVIDTVFDDNWEPMLYLAEKAIKP